MSIYFSWKRVFKLCLFDYLSVRYVLNLNVIKFCELIGINWNVCKSIGKVFCLYNSVIV